MGCSHWRPRPSIYRDGSQARTSWKKGRGGDLRRHRRTGIRGWPRDRPLRYRCSCSDGSQAEDLERGSTAARSQFFNFPQGDQIMPVLNNAKHEQFALAMASGLTPSKAYIRAGFSPRGARAGAHRLLSNIDVAARVLEAQMTISNEVIAGVITRQVCERNARLAEWQARWDEMRDALDAILAERGEELATEVAGGATGFLRKELKGLL